MSDAKDKRKRDQDDGVSPSQKKPREEDSTAVTDEEVEEFYAIIHRINTALKHFKSYGNDVAALEKDIMQEVKEAKRNEKDGKVEENLSLDLNVSPKTLS
ncbi:hypothetical protein ACSQ67_013642 [Phaseolus vulgaris]